MSQEGARRVRLGAEPTSLVATATAGFFFSLAAYVGPVFLAGAALLGLVVLAVLVFDVRLRVRGVTAYLALLAGVLLLLGLAAPTYTRFPHPSGLFFAVHASVLALALGAIVIRHDQVRRARVALVAAVVVVTAVTGFAVVNATEGAGLDVAHLHVAAADALMRGLSPYGEAVTVANGSPFAEPGSLIVGYPYPPLTAILYAIPTWLLGDPRWLSLASWLVALSVAGFASSSRWQRTSLLPLILMAGIPAWPLVLQAAWTEMLTLGLIAVALATWVKWPYFAAVVLGLVVATKQYFVVAIPLVLLHPDLRGRRSTVAVVTAALTAIPFALTDPSHLWQAAVSFHANTPPRPDSINLLGLLANLGVSWAPPLWLALGLPFLIALAIAGRSEGRPGLLRALALVLGVFFMLSSQANVNYWFLVAGFCGLAASYQAETLELGVYVAARNTS